MSTVLRRVSPPDWMTDIVGFSGENTQIKIFIALPCVSGYVSAHTMLSLSQLCVEFVRQKVSFEMHPLLGCSIISHARNILASQFRRSDCTHIFWVDDDISFRPEVFFRLFSVTCTEENEAHIACAVYPRKHLAPENLAQSVRDHARSAARAARSVAESILFRAMDYAIVPEKETSEGNLVFLPIVSAPIGCSVMTRSVFDQIAQAYPDLADQKGQIDFFFDLPPASGIGEDVAFMTRARGAGIVPVVDLDSCVSHSGVFVYRGDLRAAFQLIE